MWIPLAIMAVGAVNQAVSAKQAGDYNARLANAEGAQALAEARVEEERSRRAFQRLIGTQRAGFGASGTAVDTGSALEVVVDQAGEAELEALSIRYGGAARQAAAANRAKAAKFQANQAATAAIISGASSVASYGASAGWFSGAETSAINPLAYPALRFRDG